MFWFAWGGKKLNLSITQKLLPNTNEGEKKSAVTVCLFVCFCWRCTLTRTLIRTFWPRTRLRYRFFLRGCRGLEELLEELTSTNKMSENSVDVVCRELSMPSLIRPCAHVSHIQNLKDGAGNYIFFISKHISTSHLILYTAVSFINPLAYSKCKLRND